MKKYIKLAAGLLLFVVLIGGSTLVYQNLIKQYKSDSDLMGQEEITQKEEVKKEGLSDMETLDFTVVNSENEDITLSSMKGKPLVLNIWASWCGPCQNEMPHLQAASEEYAGTVEFMMVNLTDGYQETKESAAAFINKGGYTFPVYYDEYQNAANTFIVRSIPFTYFFDREGNIKTKVIGYMSEEKLKKGIEMITSD